MACGWSAIIGGFIFFTDTHVRSWRILGGAFHALLHLAAAFVVGWLALLLTVQGFDLALRQHGAAAAVRRSITFVLGGPVGAFILGVYLFVSIRIFGRHGNEAFSSLRIQDYKQWLRLRIDAAGVLTIYAIAHRSGAAPLARGAARRRSRRSRRTTRGRRAPRLIDRVEVRP